MAVHLVEPHVSKDKREGESGGNTSRKEKQKMEKRRLYRDEGESKMKEQCC